MCNGVDVDGVGGLTPRLDLLGHLLGVRGSENTYFACGLERDGQMLEKAGDGIRKSHRSEHAGAE